jgi:hypothetical protein
LPPMSLGQALLEDEPYEPYAPDAPDAPDAPLVVMDFPVAAAALAAVPVPLPKVGLCVLLTQFGKTFVAVEKIMERVQAIPDGVHVVYTMNSLLNNSQFAQRLRPIEDRFGRGSVVILASKNSTDYYSVDNLVQLQALPVPPKVVVMCSNKTRFDDGFAYVHGLNQPAFVYYDELHKYISPRIRRQIEALHDEPHVQGIMALTATPDSILQARGRWTILPLTRSARVAPDNYTGANEMRFHTVDDFFPVPYENPEFNDFETMDREMVGFIEHTFDSQGLVLAPHTRWFLPAQIRRVGHDRVRQFVWNRNPDTVVVLVNGEDKTMQWITQTQEGPRPVIVPLKSSTQEVPELVAFILRTRGLEQRPLVFTGYYCVGMGQTLMNEELGSFTHAIFSHMNVNRDDMYQLFGRITGRSRGWRTYVPTDVYCPTAISRRIHLMEHAALRMLTEPTITRASYRIPLLQLIAEEEARLARRRGGYEEDEKKE